MGGLFLRRDRHARIAKRREIERLADPVIGQQTRGKQLVRPHVGKNLPLVHQHDAVHAAPHHILQAVLDDDYRGSGPVLDVVDQLNGLLAGSGVQVGQRLVKEQHLHLIHHHARQAYALLLPAAELMRRMAQVMLHAHQRGHAVHRLAHGGLRHAVVFQRKGDILAHSQADELAVRVLKHRTHVA